MILDGSIVPPNSVIPSFSVFGGCPAKFIDDLPDCYQDLCKDRLDHAFKYEYTFE